MLNKRDHGFRYYTSELRGPSGGPRTSTQPAPQRSKALKEAPSPIERNARSGSNRVRVAAGAGDKCVPPAKSKPKKRKAVKEGDGPAIGMECVDWSEEGYNVSQLVSAFGHQLPVIAKASVGTTDGQLAPIGHDQVLQVHSFGRQKRIRARLVKGGGKLSFPYDYPMEIYTKEGNTGGWIDQNDVVLIPSNAEVTFNVAVGMRNASNAECDDYFGMFARSVRHLKFELLTGYPGVILEDSNARSSVVASVIADKAVYENVNEMIAEPEPNVYENVLKEQKPSVEENPAVEHYVVNDKTYARISAHERPDKMDGAVINDSVISLPPPPVPQKDLQSPRSDRPDTPFSEMDGEDLQEMFLSMVSLVQEQDKMEEEMKKSLERGDATEHKVVVETHQPPQSYSNPAFQPDEAQERKKIPPKVERKPKISKNQLNIEKKNVRNRYENDSETFPRTGASSEDPSGHGQDRPKVGRVSVKRNSPPPRAVVQPTVKESPQVTGNIVQVTITEKDDRRASTHSVSQIEAIEDVPDSLEGLTVTDVCQCLSLLNMDAHIKHFRMHQVDGGLLADMKEKVLVDEFKFTPFNASKLMRFVRGWRPKLV